MLMSTHSLRVTYGLLKALHDVSIHIGEGEILSIIGANGAGKSTLLRTITGIVRPVSGEIEFRGRKITRERPDRIVRMGMAMVPEGRQVFPELSVRENLEVGAHTVRNRSLKSELFDLCLSTFPRLKERLRQHAGTLSGGEQQMLAVARALMSNPRLLLLDEPSMGLSPIMTREIFSLIRTVNEKGISVVLVEQNANMALSYSQRAYVLETGRIVMEGESAAVRTDPAVMGAYLGT